MVFNFAVPTALTTRVVLVKQKQKSLFLSNNQKEIELQQTTRPENYWGKEKNVTTIAGQKGRWHEISPTSSNVANRHT